MRQRLGAQKAAQKVQLYFLIKKITKCIAFVLKEQKVFVNYFYFIFLFKCIFWVLDIGVSTNMQCCSSCKKMCAPLTTSTLSVLHFKSAQIGFFVELAS